MLSELDRSTRRIPRRSLEDRWLPGHVADEVSRHGRKREWETDWSHSRIGTRDSPCFLKGARHAAVECRMPCDKMTQDARVRWSASAAPYRAFASSRTTSRPRAAPMTPLRSPRCMSSCASALRLAASTRMKCSASRFGGDRLGIHVDRGVGIHGLCVSCRGRGHGPAGTRVPSGWMKFMAESVCRYQPL